MKSEYPFYELTPKAIRCSYEDYSETIEIFQSTPNSQDFLKIYKLYYLHFLGFCKLRTDRNKSGVKQQHDLSLT